MATTSDLHVVETRPLVAPAVLHQELPMDAAALETVASARQRIQDILSGRDDRLLVVVDAQETPDNLDDLATLLPQSQQQLDDLDLPVTLVLNKADLRTKGEVEHNTLLIGGQAAPFARTQVGAVLRPPEPPVLVCDIDGTCVLLQCRLCLTSLGCHPPHGLRTRGGPFCQRGRHFSRCAHGCRRAHCHATCSNAPSTAFTSISAWTRAPRQCCWRLARSSNTPSWPDTKPPPPCTYTDWRRARLRPRDAMIRPTRRPPRGGNATAARRPRPSPRG